MKMSHEEACNMSHELFMILQKKYMVKNKLPKKEARALADTIAFSLPKSDLFNILKHERDAQMIGNYHA